MKKIRLKGKKKDEMMVLKRLAPQIVWSGLHDDGKDQSRKQLRQAFRLVAGAKPKTYPMFNFGAFAQPSNKFQTASVDGVKVVKEVRRTIAARKAKLKHARAAMGHGHKFQRSFEALAEKGLVSSFTYSDFLHGAVLVILDMGDDNAPLAEFMEGYAEEAQPHDELQKVMEFYVRQWHKPRFLWHKPRFLKERVEEGNPREQMCILLAGINRVGQVPDTDFVGGFALNWRQYDAKGDFVGQTVHEVGVNMYGDTDYATRIAMRLANCCAFPPPPPPSRL